MDVSAEQSSPSPRLDRAHALAGDLQQLRHDQGCSQGGQVHGRFTMHRRWFFPNLAGLSQNLILQGNSRARPPGNIVGSSSDSCNFFAVPAAEAIPVLRRARIQSVSVTPSRRAAAFQARSSPENGLM